ncbi:MAG TPA: hypothetical protein VGB92_13230 [Longimicrobium sp.]
MSQRKYISEFGLNAETQLIFLAQYEDLDRLAQQPDLQEHPCHVYAICRRPRITIDPAVFAIDETMVRGRMRIQRGTSFEDRDYTTPNLLGRTDIKLRSEYPFTEFSLVAPSGERVSWGKVGMLAHYVQQMQDALDLEVLYVGQAFGSGGERTAIDRLKGHSTLLGIYAEAATRSPDQEIWLVLLNFRYLLLGSFDGITKNHGVSDEEDNAHIKRITSADLPEQLWINFTEAALIRYFDPPYNKMFRGTFPNPAHGSYHECYNLDLNLVSVAVETSEARTQLWSSAVPRAWLHLPVYPLHSAEERRSMFEIL